MEKTWHYEGKYKEGDTVHFIADANVICDDVERFADIFKNLPPKREIITPSERLVVHHNPSEVKGGGLEGAYYPGTYTLKRTNGDFIIGIPEYLITRKYKTGAGKWQN